MYFCKSSTQREINFPNKNSAAKKELEETFIFPGQKLLFVIKINLKCGQYIAICLFANIELDF